MRTRSRRFEQCLLALVLAILILATAPRPELEGRGNVGDTEARRSAHGSLFGAKFQRRLAADSADWRVVLERWQSCPANSAGGECFYFRVEDKLRRTTSELLLANETGQVDTISFVGDSRAAVLGRVTPNLSIVSVVDLHGSRLVDHYICWWPIISPANRFVAYVKWFPAHIGYNYSLTNEYLAYDLRASPEANRTPVNTRKPVNPYDVGWPLYPPGLSNTPGDNVLYAHNRPVHTLGSEGLFWLNRGDTVAFVDHWQGVDSLVLADLSGGVRHPTVMVEPLETSSVVDLSACKSKIAPSDFEKLSGDPARLIDVTDIETWKETRGRSACGLLPIRA